MTCYFSYLVLALIGSFSQTVESVSYRLEDLKSGLVKVSLNFRVLEEHHFNIFTSKVYRVLEA